MWALLVADAMAGNLCDDIKDYLDADYNKYASQFDDDECKTLCPDGQTECDGWCNMLQKAKVWVNNVTSWNDDFCGLARDNPCYSTSVDKQCTSRSAQDEAEEECGAGPSNSRSDYVKLCVAETAFRYDGHCRNLLRNKLSLVQQQVFACRGSATHDACCKGNMIHPTMSPVPAQLLHLVPAPRIGKGTTAETQSSSRKSRAIGQPRSRVVTPVTGNAEEPIKEDVKREELGKPRGYETSETEAPKNEKTLVGSEEETSVLWIIPIAVAGGLIVALGFFAYSLSLRRTRSDNEREAAHTMSTPDPEFVNGCKQKRSGESSSDTRAKNATQSGNVRCAVNQPTPDVREGTRSMNGTWSSQELRTQGPMKPRVRSGRPRCRR